MLQHDSGVKTIPYSTLYEIVSTWQKIFNRVALFVYWYPIPY